VAVPKLSGDMIPGGHLVSRLLPYGPPALVLPGCHLFNARDGR